MRFKYLSAFMPLVAVLACSGTTATKDGGSSGSSGSIASAGSAHSSGSGNSIAGDPTSSGNSSGAENGGSTALGGAPSFGGDENMPSACDQCFASKCDAESSACWDEPNCDAAQLHYDDCIASLDNVTEGDGGAPGAEANGGAAGVPSTAGSANSDLPAAPKTRADCKALAILEAKQLDGSPGAAGAAAEVPTTDSGKLVDEYLTCFEANCLSACEGP